MLAHRRDLLFRSGDISVVDFRCREQAAAGEGPEEPNPTNSIAFVRRGLFRRTASGRSIVADANHILFFNATQPYRYAHPVDGGDDCTILTMSTSYALQVVGAHSAADADRDGLPFPIGHTMSSLATLRLQYELLHALRNEPTTLAVEDLLSELTERAVRDAYDTHTRPVERSRPTLATLRRRKELTETAKVILNRAVAEPPSLHSLARALECSPFQLSRTFHSTSGVSMRRYLSRLRASAAAHHLARGASDLTALALDLGYSDHSHFTKAFRSAFGMAPSQFRAKHRRG